MSRVNMKYKGERKKRGIKNRINEIKERKKNCSFYYVSFLFLKQKKKNIHSLIDEFNHALLILICVS